MAATIPPAPPPVQLQAAAAGGGSVAVVVSGGQSLQGLPAGTMLEAVTLMRALRGTVQVQSGDQTFSLKLPADMQALPPGSRLVMQMMPTPTGDAPQLRILGLNNRVLAPGVQGAAPQPASLPNGLAAPTAPSLFNAAAASGANTGGTPPTVLNTVQTVASGPSASAAPAAITATILRPAAGGTANPAAAGGLPPNLPPGTTIGVRIVATAPPAVSAGQPGNVVPAMPQPAAGASPSPTRPAQTPQATTPQSGVVTSPLASGAAPSPGILTGTVATHPPGGQAVVQTPAGTMAVPVAGDLAVGSRVTLEVVGKPELPPPPAAAAKSQGLSQTGWPALTDATAALQRSDAQLAEQFMRILPQANARLAASMAIFASALRSGDARQIVSDAVMRGLERAGKKDVGEKLKGDVEKLSSDSTRSLGGGNEWRALSMPFMNGAQIEAIRLYTRGAPPEEDAQGRGGKGDGSRFVLEVSMSRLGRVQLDGLVRREDKAFDLIIRTGQPLPAEMRHDIMAIFTENAEICGITGSVGFQAGRFVDLPPVEAPSTTALTV